MMRRIRNSVLLATFAAMTGCGQPNAPDKTSPSAAHDDHPAAAHAGPFELVDAEEVFRVSFHPEPGPIRTSAPFSMHVDVTRIATGQPIGDEAMLFVDAAMPEHRHGMNTQPRVHRAGPGHFDVDGMLLHMPGRWELYFDVVEGAVTRRAMLELELE